MRKTVKYIVIGGVAWFFLARYLAGRTANNSGSCRPAIDDRRLIM